MKLSTSFACLLLPALAGWAFALSSAAFLPVDDGQDVRLARRDVPTFSGRLGAVSRVFYCEPIRFDWANPNGVDRLTNNATITVWSRGDRLSEQVLRYTAETHYQGGSWTWTPDVPAGQQILIYVKDAYIGQTTNTTGTASLIPVGVFIQNSTRPCDQSALTLPYDPASVVASSGFQQLHRPALLSTFAVTVAVIGGFIAAG